MEALKQIFKETIVNETDEYCLMQRHFFKNSHEEELVWHRDKEDRDVFLIEGDSWYIQRENELPQLIQKDFVFKIPKDTWHRVINKNGKNLIINIKKYKNSVI